MAIWRVTCGGLLYGIEKWANVFHVDGAGAPPTTVLDAFEAAYNTAATGGGIAWLTPCPGTVAVGVDGVTHSYIQMQALVSPAPPIERPLAHVGGQNTPGGLPLDVSPVMSWKTPFAGRSFRGRTYLPPWHENQNVDTGVVGPQPLQATVTGVVINAKKLVTTLDGLAWPLVVYSRTLGSAQLVTSGYMDSDWDTQRRRSNKLPRSRTQFVTP